MRILVFDTIFPFGHKVLNNKIIDLLQKQTVFATNYENYYDKQRLKNTKFSNIYKFNFKVKKIPYYIQTLVNSILNSFKFLGKKYDITLVTTFNTVTFAISRFLLSGNNKVLIHHLNTSELSNNHKLKIFKTYQNKVFHIVFAQFIKDYLVGLGTKPERIFVLPHPMTGKISQATISESRTFVGLGFGNDEDLIRGILEYERKNGLLKKHNVNLLLRWNREPLKEDHISIISGPLERDEYEKVYSQASSILLLYPKSYQNRFSGAIMDAIRHGKTIIGANIPIVKEMSEVYPHSCSTFNNVEEFFKIIINHKIDIEKIREDQKRFIRYHADQNVQKILISIL